MPAMGSETVPMEEDNNDNKPLHVDVQDLTFQYPGKEVCVHSFHSRQVLTSLYTYKYINISTI